MSIGIYKITNKVNNKVYIGQSVDIFQRWKEHKSYAFCEKRECYNNHLYCAIRKYGLENFKFQIIEECNKDELDVKEQYWIKYYDSINPNKGYNLVLSNQTANHQNLKVKQYDLNGNYIATFNSFREAERCTGADHTLISRCCDKTKGNRMAGNYQWCLENESLDGYKYQSVKKRIGRFGLDGTFIEEYSSIKEAADRMGVKSQSISNALKHGYKSCGFIWKKLD